LWWNNGEIIKRIENSKDENKNMRMWICMGTLEGSIDKETKESTAVKDTRKLAEILEKKKFLKNQDFVYYEVEGEGHDEGAWSRRIHLPLTYFFGNWEKSFEIQEHINKGHYYKEKVNLTDNSKADIPMSCS
jgi:predicted alpha/beta superfamily hydrolase